MPELEQGAHFSVQPDHDGFTIFTRGGWGLGFTFNNAETANAACRALNDNAELDAMLVKP